LLLNSPQTLENTGFIAGELSLIVSLVLYHMSPRASVMTCARISVLHYIVPPVFTNSDKGKYKDAGPLLCADRSGSGDQEKSIKQYNTK